MYLCLKIICMLRIKKLGFILIFFVFYFVAENSNSQSINKFNATNQRTGIWKKYYSNNRIRYVGQFENGKEVGVFKFYDMSSSNHPVIIKTFFKDSDSLFVQFYSLDGIINTEGIIRGRKRVGNWKYFYKNGTVMSEENYINGSLNGEQVIFYPDGQVTESTLYKEGLLDGFTSKFSSKGVLIEKVCYKEGEPNGLAKYFELNGNLKETGYYKEGKRVGEWEYYMDGEIVTDDEKKKNKATFTKEKNN